MKNIQVIILGCLLTVLVIPVVFGEPSTLQNSSVEDLLRVNQNNEKSRQCNQWDPRC